MGWGCPVKLGSESSDSVLPDAVLLISELNDGQTGNATEMTRIDRQHRVPGRERRGSDQEIRERNHDAVLLLLGVQLARKLRADPRTRRMRLVALTGMGRSSDMARTREAGFVAHLKKPASLDVIALLAGGAPPGA